MAILQHPQIHSPFLSDNILFCEEEQLPWDSYKEEEIAAIIEDSSTTATKPSGGGCSFLLMDGQDLFWEDEELVSLFSKEQQQAHHINLMYSSSEGRQTDPCLLLARKEAVDWILKVKAHYGFSPLTAVLSLNYLDRFLSTLHFQKDKPWMIQLLAVTCLSLAAKVEETQVPLLLDLQVEDTKYLFEAKNIQKMELLVMSTLQWRMNPVTPISFLDHIVRRLGLKTHLHWEFLKRCEALILFALSDSRFVRYLPSVVATAVMLHVIDQVVESSSSHHHHHYDNNNNNTTTIEIDYHNQLLSVLNTTKEKVRECYAGIVEIAKGCSYGEDLKNHHHRKKRKYEEIMNNSNVVKNAAAGGNPVGVTDADVFSCDDDSSNDSWGLNLLRASSETLSDDEDDENGQPFFKKKKKKLDHHQEQQQQLLPPPPQLGCGSISSRVFVDVISSPH